MKNSKKVAIILSGCGVQDGSEIHESVLTLLALVKSGATPLFYAPSIEQAKVANHLTGEESDERRSVLIESARIARGAAKDLAELEISDADAIVFPGGYGAALNLCSFGKDGAGCSVDPQVSRVVKEFHAAGKPSGFICIAPAIAAAVLGKNNVELTIGTDESTASELKKMGAAHVAKAVDEIHIDSKNKVVSTPAYMLAKNIAEAQSGIEKLVSALLEMI